MEKHSTQKDIFIPLIHKQIRVYEYGESAKKVLLVHGWSGRGTQLVKFADDLIKTGYATISFDAPAHGKSGTKTTLMPEFIAAILELERIYGPFHAAIGHSLGGMALLNSMRQGLQLNSLIIIGSGDKIEDIIDDFVKKLALKIAVATELKKTFKKRYGVAMADFASNIAAQSVKIPTLVIHDENDIEVPVYCAKAIVANLKNGELFLTKQLGHRKILGSPIVISKTLTHIASHSI